MRIIVKKLDRIVNEFHFKRGPVYIGRHANSQVFLPSNEISRQHAVIFNGKDGNWIAEDMDSANKTFLNGEPIYKSEIKTGDVLKIGPFTLEIDLNSDRQPSLEDFNHVKPINLEDTLVSSGGDFQIILRKISHETAPAVKFSSRRIYDYFTATDEISRANGLEETGSAIFHIAKSQFSYYHSWCALRLECDGPMVHNKGKIRGGGTINLEQIKLHDRIQAAVEKRQFYLLPKLPLNFSADKIQSALIAPILGSKGCYGGIYIDNAMDHEHFTLGDLDYLILLTIHLGALLEHF